MLISHGYSSKIFRFHFATKSLFGTLYLGFDPWQRQRIFPLVSVQTSSEAHPALYPVGTYWWFFPRGKAQPGHDTDYLSPFNAEVKNEYE
jgi:hypothetical protein